MRTLFDTSVMVAALVEQHPKHERVLPWLSKAKARKFEFVIASHSLAELYAVLTTLPLKPRISTGIAWRLISENITSAAKIVSLSPTEYSSIINKVSDIGLSGGIVYDALIVGVAQKSKVERILTLNRKHFKKLWQANENIIFEP
jgi:predicted nucleic acid-binding protein